MQKDDSFNDSDEIINMYSSKNVKETFKTQFRKLLSSNPSLTNCVKNEIVSKKNDERESVKPLEDTSSVNGTYESSSSVEKCDDSVLEDSIEVIECPAPRRTRRSERLRSRRTETNCFSEISDVESPIVKTTRPRKRKTEGHKRQKKSAVEEVILLDSPESSEALDDEEINPEISVKIIWKSVAIKKFQIRKFQKMSKIFEELSKEENVPMDKIILSFNNVRVNPNDTPDSLNLQVFHFLDGGILNQSTNSFISLSSSAPSQNENLISLKFQDVNKKIVRVTLNKDDKMKVGMIKCSEQLEVPLEKIKFYFDGEQLDSMETPLSLGLENDEIIDFKINKS